VSHGAVTFV